MAEVKSQFDILGCTDEDIPECFNVISNSFGHDAPFVDAFFLDHDTDAGRKQGSKRLLAWKNSAPQSSFLKATTKAHSGEQRVVGIAIWTFMKTPPPGDLGAEEDVKQFWPNEDDREFMKGLWEKYIIPRSQAITESKGEGVYVLEMLAVHRDFQRKGAGSALVRWGTSKAGSLKVKAVVEATHAGQKTYENCGFKTEIEQMDLDPGERFANRDLPALIFMGRK